MQLGSLAGEGHKALGARTTLVNLLPAALLTLLVVTLVGSGAPGQPKLERAIDTYESLNGVRLAVLGLAVLGVAVILKPFQIAVVQLLEGYWIVSPLKSGSAFLKKAFDMGVEVQRRRHRALSILQEIDNPRISDVQRVWLDEELQFYPREQDLLPTRLGNILRGAENRAGGRYGLNAVVTFPHLYPQMSDRLATTWDDLTDRLDASAHLCVTFLLATLISAALLAPYTRAGYWLLIPLGAGTLTWISYRASIAAAKQQGVILMVAFDLHRFDLLSKFRYPMPHDANTEFERNLRLTEFLATANDENRARLYKEGRPMEPVEGYEHPDSGASPSPEPKPGEVGPLLWDWDAVNAAATGDQDRVRNDRG